MPYILRSLVDDGHVCYAVENKETGKRYGVTSKEKAEAQLRLLRMLEHEEMSSEEDEPKRKKQKK